MARARTNSRSSRTCSPGARFGPVGSPTGAEGLAELRAYPREAFLGVFLGLGEDGRWGNSRESERPREGKGDGLRGLHAFDSRVSDGACGLERTREGHFDGGLEPSGRITTL